MKPTRILSSSIIACLLATASRAAVIPYAEYHLGEAGSLGSSNKPQDATGNNRNFSDDINGGSATVGSTDFHPNATGSTAYLDTSNTSINDGWYSGNMYSTLPTENFAFGIFARASANASANQADIFTLGNVGGSHKISLENNGWSASAHNINWIAPPGGVTGSFTPNVWVHLAIIRTGGVSTFYIDGVAHGTYNGSVAHASPHMSVSPGGGSYFDGQLDEARVVTFTPGETTANILAALQGGIIPNSFVNVGTGANFRIANLSTDQASTFRLGGAIQDSVIVNQDGGLTVVAGTAPKHIINIAQEGEIPTGTYTLIDYTGTIGGLGFAGLQLAPLPGRIAGSLINNVANSSVDLEITGSQAGDITWKGNGSGTWNVEANANWVFSGGSTPTKFYSGDTVRFDDNAVTNTVTLAGTITPSAVSITADEDYTFSGAGIGGSGTLEKIGAGMLTLTNDNTQSGFITVDGGTLRIGDGGSTGSLGSGGLSLNGNLVINRSGNVTVSNNISGEGSVQKLGDGRALMTGGSSYNGSTTVTAGMIASGNSSCLGSDTGATTVAAGASLDCYSGGFGGEPITVNGTGVNGEGVIINTSVAGQLNGVKKLTLGSDSTIGGTGRWDVRGDGAYVAGNFKLTKIGNNQISLVQAAVSVKDIEVQGGLLSVEYGANVDNTNAGTITMLAGTLGFGSFSNPITCSKPIVLNGGAINTTWTDGDGNATVASTVQLTAASNTISAQGGSTLTLNGAVSGTGALVKGDSGTVTLGLAPAYTGNTTVSSGTLSLTASGLADSSTVNVATAGTLNLNFAGTDTVSALFINDVQQPAGVYNSGHASGRFTGTGSLTVSTGPVGSPYQLWETSNGITAAGANADPDNDGISNAIEFVIGSDPSGPGSESSALLPTITKTATNLVFVFRRTDESASLNPFVEYGSSLTGWTTAQNGVGGVTILQEDNAIAAGIDRVTVTIPLPAGTQKFFARLRVNP
ncbi:autotransporter-associated beta strand repeat-containing protein [Haloferula sp. BvORR071]|uniref:beta strand repeat-containing protein n=1 Tax=Haloferula sp. BvORR071 TaxID=1396141 RepID=UPI00054E323D|nr:autotransporter-associated beta strand repeat-containing protein [Haloferula sp. BvORR071]